MANIVITAVGGKNYHKIAFNDLAAITGFEYRYFWADEILFIDSDGFVTIHMKGTGEIWRLSTDGNSETLQVDTVLGASPSSEDDLALKIADLKG